MKNKKTEAPAEQEFSWRVQNHKSTPLGFKAVIAIEQKGQTIFKDEVQLSLANSRSRFVSRLLKALDYRPKGKSKIKELAEAISKWMIELESELAALNQDKPEKPVGSSEANKNQEAKIEFLKDIKLGHLHNTLGEIISSPYCSDVLELTLATVLNASKRDDGLVWVFIIGEPSTGKTETVEGVRHEPTVYFLDSLTVKAFITGLVNQDGISPTDLLSELDRKCLLVKDLTPLFSGRDEITRSVLGQMVSIYDGSFARKTGTREKVEYKSRFSFVACITPKGMEKHVRYIQEMGSRLLFYRLPSLNAEQQNLGMNRMFENGKRTAKVETYRKLCSSFIHEKLATDLPEVQISEEYRERLKQMAQLLAKGRTLALKEKKMESRTTKTSSKPKDRFEFSVSYKV
jgi:hypothetical protein